MIKKAKRVFVFGFVQESNAFNPVLAKIDAFEGFGIYRGEEIFYSGAHCGVTIEGAIQVLKENGYEVVGGVVMRAGSGGPVDSALIKEFCDENLKLLKDAGDVCGVVASLHGATVSDTSFDVCGDILQGVREVVGEKAVISAAFDLHANITEKIKVNADYVCGYQTYPHLDLREVGIRAAKRVVNHFKKGKSSVAYSHVPVIAPAHAYSTEKGKLNSLMGRAKDMATAGVIEDYSIFQVQPWLDVKEMSATVVITAKDEDTAKRAAELLAKELFSIRADLQGSPLYTIEEVIDIALENKTGKPIVLVDSADSPNAGACGDSVAMLEQLLKVKDKISCALAVIDKNAVDKAFELGVGGVGTFTLGASLASKLTKPVTVENATVKSLHDGVFYLFGPQEKGERRDIGKTAVLKVGKILIQVSYYGCANGDKAFYHTFGINPETTDLVCVKACTSFRAGYETFSAQICNTQTPGAAAPVLQTLPYEYRPKPLYPFEEITIDSVTAPKIYR